MFVFVSARSSVEQGFVHRWHRYLCAFVCVIAGLVPATVWAQSGGGVIGVVVDQVGARLPGATVTLVGERQDAATATAGSDGSYSIGAVASGRYRIRAELAGFDTTTSAPFYVGGGTVT